MMVNLAIWNSLQKYIVAVRKPNLIAHYKTLDEKLLSAAEYEEPNDFTSVNARFRYVYLHEISLPFKVEV